MLLLLTSNCWYYRVHIAVTSMRLVHVACYMQWWQNTDKGCTL
jgi:hypothetical protein